MKTRSEQKRIDILNAAKQTFLESGVKQTSMDKIASVAQVSKRTVYNHFESKEALVVAIFSHFWQQDPDNSLLDDIAHLPLKQQLIQILLAEIEIYRNSEYMTLTQIAFGHFIHRPEELQKHFMSKHLKLTPLQLWLEKYNNLGELHFDDTEFTYQQIHGLVKTHCFWPQLMGLQAAVSEEQALFVAQSTAQLFLYD